MAEVRLEGVTKQYGSVTAVDNLDLTIADREFVSLLGPSGCGKSTILYTIAGLVQATRGSIYIDGQRVNDLAPKDRGVAMVFQDYALYPHMTVYENLAFPLKALRMSESEMRAKIHDAAEILGISEFLQRLPKQLSGGQRQRVALGRSIVRRPKVFLMDEPLSNLDARLRLNMRAELKRLHHQLQATIIYVTHDQAEAMTLSDRIAVLSSGKLQQYAPPFELYDQPSNVFVGGFVGAMPMNFFEATVVLHNGTIRLEANGFAFHSKVLKKVIPSDYAGKQVSLGIRSENVVVAEPGTEGALLAHVEILEQLGSDLYIYARLGADNVLVRAAPDLPIREGDHVFLRFIDERFRVFDRESGGLIS